MLRHERDKRTKLVTRNHCSIHNISCRTTHCQLDVLWRRKGRTLQAACPKHKMQITARGCFLNHIGSGQRILDEMKQQVVQLLSLLHFYQRHKLICCRYSLIHYKEEAKWGLQTAPQFSVQKECCSRNFSPPSQCLATFMKTRSTGCLLCRLLPDYKLLPSAPPLLPLLLIHLADVMFS